jgi:catechol 2,3-dioxygenase-like lactoylglutathione lyase family enzyme
MRQSIGYVALVVRDYDEAIAFFTRTLSFELVEDTPIEGKRWVRVAPPGSRGTCLVLARATTPEQLARVGNQTGGRVSFFLHTDDFWRDYRELKAKGVAFEREPKEESYGTVAVFRDLYRNLWDLLELKGVASGAVHHIDLTVRDLARSTEFYDRVLPLLGFRRGVGEPDGPLWAGAELEIGLQAAVSPTAHDRYAPGLHHLAFAAPSRAAVDAAHRSLLALGVTILNTPADYPQYAPGYYAVFFADPDGIKLEYAYTPRWPQ